MAHIPSRSGRGAARLTALVAAVGLVLAVQVAPAGAAPGRIRAERAPDAIAGSYIVVLRDAAVAGRRVNDVIGSLAGEHDATVSQRYSNALRGFAATMPRAQALALSREPSVAYVEQDRRVHLSATQSPTPSWGLDRIDQRDLPLNSAYTYPNTAAGVTAYVIDTGIRTTHTDFGGRAVWGTTTTGDGNNTDCNGHGTHVAGTVGGTSYGVAKGVRLVAVKVLNCAGSGSFSGVTAGIDWVTGNHTTGPAVANMSLGGAGSSAATETAVRNSIADGVTYAIAAGNSSTDACGQTPARVAEAITVGASTRTDARASFSNVGTCLDIFAPGEQITSAWSTGNTAINTISGTSMASPHVAGVAALILGATPSATPSQVWSAMQAGSTPNRVTNPGSGSPNRLLNVETTAPPEPPPSTCLPRTNATDVAVPDNATVTSTIAVSGCTGNASASSTIEVHVVHTWIGDLVVDLVAPDGSVYNLHNRAGGRADDIHVTYSRNLSSEPVNGSWTLRVRDAASQDTGRIDSWTLDP